MARVRAEEAEASFSLRVVTPILHYCPIFDKYIGEAECRENTRIPENNTSFCRTANCSSEWRICYACLEQETISRVYRVINRQKGLCSFHEKWGPMARRIQPRKGMHPANIAHPQLHSQLAYATLPQEVETRYTTPEKIAQAIRMKMKREGLTIPDVAEELGHPPQWIIGQLRLLRQRGRREAEPPVTPPAANDHPVQFIHQARVGQISFRKEGVTVAEGEKVDIARAVKKLKEAGKSVAEIAKQYKHSAAWVYAKLKLPGDGKNTRGGKTGRNKTKAPRNTVARRNTPALDDEGRIAAAVAKIREGFGEVRAIKTEMGARVAHLTQAEESIRALFDGETVDQKKSKKK